MSSAAGPSESAALSTTPAPALAPAPAAGSAAPQPPAPTTTTATTEAPEPAQLSADNLQQHDQDQAEQGDDHQQLVPDTATDSDTDSAFDSASHASTSIASSVLNYEYANGRRYHGYRSGAYVLPNDETEQDRLDLLHHIFLLALGGSLFLAPLDKGKIQRVLDVGTGTGIWALDFGDWYPGSEVIGTDLSPIQPHSVAPNVRFYIDDAESDWVYAPHERFDYIHLRGLAGGIKDWDRLVRQCYENMQPGGYVEFQEPEAWFFSDDDSMDRAPNMMQWQILCNQAAEKFGKEIRISTLLKGKLENAGFVDVQEKIVHIPIGPWAKDARMKEIGRFQREHVSVGIEPYTYGFIGKVLGWSADECKIMTAKVVNEVRDRSLHNYVKFYFVYGRKPESALH